MIVISTSGNRVEKQDSAYGLLRPHYYAALLFEML
jgi:hypothetical protein